MKPEAKKHFFVVTNLFLLVIAAILIVVVPFFKGLYDNAGAELPLPTLWILLCSQFWYISIPLMFAGGNWLIKFCLDKFENIFEKSASWFYGTLVLVIFLTLCIFAMGFLLPLGGGCHVIK